MSGNAPLADVLRAYLNQLRLLDPLDAADGRARLQNQTAVHTLAITTDGRASLSSRSRIHAMHRSEGHCSVMLIPGSNCVRFLHASRTKMRFCACNPFRHSAALT